MIIKVEEGQTVYDIAVQYYGDINKLQKLLDDNDIDRDVVLYSGQELYIDDMFPKDVITNYFINKSINNDDSIKEYVDLDNEQVHIVNIEQPKNPILNNVWTVEEGQTVYDIATMFYGSPDKVTKLFEDNPTLNYNSVLYSGQKIKLSFSNEELNNVIYANTINNTDSEYRYVGEFKINVLQVEPETADSLGYAYLEALGGVAPYTFSWSNGSDSLNLVGVHTGSYILTATDSENNEIVITIYIAFYEQTETLSKPSVPGEYYTGPYDSILTSNGDRILINIKTTELL